jgi:hypothetical protein
VAGSGRGGIAGGEGAVRRPSSLVRVGILAIGLGFVVGACGGAASATSSLSPSAGASAAASLDAVASASSVPAASEPAVSGPVPAATTAPSGAPTAAPTAMAVPTATPNVNPRIVTWDAPKYEDCTGTTAGSITVSWEIRRATGVTISIDGPGIYDEYDSLEDTITLPYGCGPAVLQHTYTLVTVGGVGPAATLTRTVRTRAPEILAFTMGTPECGAGDTSIGIAMSFEIRAATGAALSRDGAPYSTYNTKATDDIIQYDCTKALQTFELTTTGGYGAADSESIVVVQVPH